MKNNQKTQNKTAAEKLIELGFSQNDVAELIEQLQYGITEALVREVFSSLSEAEINRMNKILEKSNLNETDRISLIAKLFNEKTGKSLTERAQKLLQNYLENLVQAINVFKDAEQKIKVTSSEKQQELQQVLENKEWARVKRLLDELNITL